VKRPEPVNVVKQRRDAALQSLIEGVPYIRFMGFVFDRRGDELTGIMPYQDMLIGNPMLPALHGGATAAFLETTAIIELSWAMMWDEMETGADTTPPRLPKTIDFTVDYLRGLCPCRSMARQPRPPVRTSNGALSDAAINIRAADVFSHFRCCAWRSSRGFGAARTS